MIQAAKNQGENQMLMRWKVLALLIIVALAGSAVLVHNSAEAAPQASAPAKAAAAAPAGAISIPDTTIAINSSTPMSQRIVHYEIEAKYDAAKYAPRSCGQ